MNAKKLNQHNAAIGKYGIIVVLLLIGAVYIFIRTGQIAAPSEERDRLRNEGRRAVETSDRVILPRRGSIYTHDGRLLAASESSFIINLDFRAYRLREDSIMNHVDAVAASLARMFPERTAAQYRQIIVNGWRNRDRERHARLIPRDINYLELRALRECTHMFHSTLRRGISTTVRNARINPLGDLASRTIGGLHRDLDEGGSSGLEQRFEAYLRGESGVRNRQRRRERVEGGRDRDVWVDVIQTPPKDGYDIVTTLDVDIQEITYRTLRNRLIDLNASAGTAIVMEVQSGAIRGITNLDRVRRGEYAEGRPHAFSMMHEPGSTFKTIATLVALEDGLVQPTDTFRVGTGVWRPNQHFPNGIRDWNAERWDDNNRVINRGYMTLQEGGMAMSSNVVMARMLMSRYSDNPRRFIEGVERTGLMDNTLQWCVPLQGIEGTMTMHRPGEPGWSNFTSLGVMSFGYAVQVPPIRMLMFHNAIANNGRMIQPFIAQRIMQDGRTVREFSANVVNSRIASRRTIAQMHDMLVAVTENEHGTGRTYIRSSYFSIAGKTGTAVIPGGHFVSFVGYFPADNPQYSIFVGIQNAEGIQSGARMAGVVFRDIAEQIFVRNERLPVNYVRIDENLPQEPRMNHGSWQHNRTLLTSLRMPVTGAREATDWVRMQRDSIGNFQPQALPVEADVVPDVRGMGARDALYLLERSGLQVNIRGSGRVREQSLAPGSRFARGNRIDITLR